MQITDHIHALKIPFQIPVAPGKTFERFVYAYLILGPEICLIDSGVKDSGQMIFKYLKDLGRIPEEISRLVLTHAHPDHIGSARAIQEATSCTVAAHPDAQAWIEDVAQQFTERPVPGFHTLVGENTTVDQLLRDGEIIDLGNLSLEIMHTPGHSRGSISLYCKEEEILFTGDAIPQTGDLPIYEDVETSVQSIKKLKEINAMQYLLTSWADALEGGAASKMIDDGLAYLQRIHGVVRQIAAENEAVGPMELCAKAVKALGLPDVAVNPLIAKSFVSHLKSDGSVKNLTFLNGTD